MTCNACKICREVIGDYVKSGEPIVVRDLYKSIQEAGGILRVEANYTVKEFMENTLLNRGIYQKTVDSILGIIYTPVITN